ncbi:MAG TPA: alpha-glucuronidase family glycosyl hydrolase [Nocardioidaceae bacterium]|jgi:alpha-glucuronidase
MAELTRRTFLRAGGVAALGGYLALASGGPIPAAALAGDGVPVEDGYELWLRYRPVQNRARAREYAAAIRSVVSDDTSTLVTSAAAELQRGLGGLLGHPAPRSGEVAEGAVVVGTRAGSRFVRSHVPASELAGLGDEGYLLRRTSIDGKRVILIASEGGRGALYGAFHLLRLLQTEQRLQGLDLHESPAAPLRLVNHWDNLDRSVERGYAGQSIFAWDELPRLSRRYTDYARALASVGLNGTVVNNVNANPHFLDSDRLPGLAALATVLRDWGVRFYLSANYASPMVLTAGTSSPITSADPFDPDVRRWWHQKVEEVYSAIPDFGGFLVKANSEGQPGPLDYGRTHADGANMLADLVAPHDGIIMWRSFVHEGFDDWASYEYKAFHPLDGDFATNVAVQTKNGPIDFQVREPVNPLFGGMPHTNQMIELQITQEYTGHNTDVCYLVSEWKQILDFDTGGPDRGPTVADIVDGAAYDQNIVGFAGVINFGDDRDWTGYQLGAANTHGFARLAWNPRLSAEDLAREWVQMTFGCTPVVVETISAILLSSWETYEDYTSPLGMGYLTYPLGAHYEPDPRSTLNLSHYTNSNGTGFDRTVATGTGFTGLYAEPWTARYESLATMPDELLLFMHWVPYRHRLQSGSTVIQHIYDSHFTGLQQVHKYRDAWLRLAPWIDDQRHADVAATFDQHVDHATRWRDSIVAFFFRYCRILDEQRSWLQVELNDGNDLLFGGWPNRVPIDVGNATPDDLSVSAILDAPSGWTTQAGEADIASSRFGTLPMRVQPPLAAEIAALDVALTPKHLPALSARDHEFVVTPIARRCHLALDAGSETSPLVPGYQRLSPATAWDPDRGFGWVGASPQNRDRGGTLDPLRRDFCGNYPAHTLRIAVPAGEQLVSILVGDGGPDSWPTYVSVDGERIAESPHLPGGAFAWVHFTLDGGASGRQVDVTFDSEPNQFWHLCALVIPDPSSTLPPLVVTEVSAEPVWFIGQQNEVSVTVVNTVDRPIDTTVEVETPSGWVTAPVVEAVDAGEERTIVVPVTPQGFCQNASLGVRVAADVEVGDGERTTDVVAVPSGDAVSLALDAGSSVSPVLATYTRLSPADVWGADRSFGWVGAVPDDRDRNRLDVLRRDFVLGRDQTHVLRVKVPSGRHRVSVMTGDAYSPSGTTILSEDSVVLGTSGDDVIPQGEFRWFSFSLDGGANGRTADLELQGKLRDGYWRVVALVMAQE